MAHDMDKGQKPMKAFSTGGTSSVKGAGPKTSHSHSQLANKGTATAPKKNL